jgi:hypothetical protein
MNVLKICTLYTLPSIHKPSYFVWQFAIHGQHIYKHQSQICYIYIYNTHGISKNQYKPIFKNLYIYIYNNCSAFLRLRWAAPSPDRPGADPRLHGHIYVYIRCVHMYIYIHRLRHKIVGEPVLLIIL